MLNVSGLSVDQLNSPSWKCRMRWIGVWGKLYPWVNHLPSAFFLKLCFMFHGLEWSNPLDNIPGCMEAQVFTGQFQVNQNTEEKTYTLKTLRHWKKKLRKIQKIKRSPCSWIDRITIVKIAILPSAVYRFNTMLQRNWKHNLKFHMDNSKNTAGHITISDFKSHYT